MINELTKSRLEREERNQAKSANKQFKKINPAYFHELRYKMAAQIMNSNTPNWGNLFVNVTKGGI